MEQISNEENYVTTYGSYQDIHATEDDWAKISDYVQETHHMFYIDYPWTYGGELDDLFKKYFTSFVTGYEISKEKKVPHLQCYAVGPPARYRAFIAKYKQLYKEKTGILPVGRAVKGGRKNYGKVKEIKKTMVNCIAYCIKDGVFSHHAIPVAIMEEAKATTYVVEGTTQKKNRIIELLKSNKDTWTHGGQEGKMDVITAICKLHFELFGMGLRQGTLDKYLLSSGLVTARAYAEANFKHVVHKYEDTYHY